MRHDYSKPRMTFFQAGAVAAVAIFAASAADAQAIRPNLAVAPRVPVIAGPPPVPHVDAGITGRLTPHPQMPNLHLSPNRHPSCTDDGKCDDTSVSSSANGLTAGNGSTGKGKNAVKSGPRRDTVQAAANLLTITNDIIAEIDGTLTNEQADALARRHGLRRIESQNFPLLGATFGLSAAAWYGRAWIPPAPLAMSEGAVGSGTPGLS